MCNSIFIDIKTLPKAKEGEEFEVTIKGVYRIDEDGTRKLDVLSVGGRDVVDPDEEESDCGCGDHDTDSGEALEIFMIETNKNKKG